jgi:ribonuclease R
MSLKEKIIKELERGPSGITGLKKKFGNNKKVTAILAKLEKEKKVVKINGYYTLASAKTVALRRSSAQSKNIVKGKIVRVAKGFGFAARIETEGEDIFIPGRYLKGAMPADEVEIKVVPEADGLFRGVVLKVIKEENTFTGILALQNGKKVIIPDSLPAYPIEVEKDAIADARIGDKVAATLTKRGTDYMWHKAKVTMCFGKAEKAESATKAVLYNLHIPQVFSEKALNEAGKLPTTIDEKETENRIDLRGHIIFTIDGAETKDMDDAVSVEKTENDGYLLGVHIADVSHYVKAHTALDDDAFERGTSVYYANKVIPMLPKELSDGLCSLNPQVDRLAFSCLINLNNSGQVEGFSFEKTVIHSRVKGVYSEINTLLEGKEAPQELAEKYSEVKGSLFLLNELYEKLDKARTARGSMEIETHESKIKINANGEVESIERRERGLAEKIVEECMLLANTCAAKLAEEKDLPFLYRVHDKPAPEKAEHLKEVLTQLNIQVSFVGLTPTQTELAKLLDKTKGTNLQTAVHFAVLRSMAKAVYSTEAKGHYGLVLSDYAHFTSPIRRYPDLFIHRVLSNYVSGKSKDELKKKYSKVASTAAQKTTEAEIRAMQAERDCTACYKAEYMGNCIGEIFTGIVTSAVLHGLYVELPNTVEGLVPARTICEQADTIKVEQGVSLAIPQTGIAYKVGDEVKVKVTAVDVAKGQVDFEIVKG